MYTDISKHYLPNCSVYVCEDKNFHLVIIDQDLCDLFASTFHLLSSLNPPPPPLSLSVWASPDYPDLLCSGSRDNSICLWDLNMGRPISSMHIPRNLVSPQTHTHHLYNYYDEPKRHVLRFVFNYKRISFISNNSLLV